MDVLIFECGSMKDGEVFPIVNTGRGQDISPEFVIDNLSSRAKTLAVTLEDIKHPLLKISPIGLSITSRPENESPELFRAVR